MLEIKNLKIYNLEESIVASGFPKSTGELAEDFENEVEKLNIYINNEMPSTAIYEEWYKKSKQHIQRAIKLANTPTGSGHSTFLTGIRVTFNLKYPEYISPQLQRYHWFDIVSSESKMHRLTHMDIKKSCNKYVDDVVIDNLNKWIGIYNNFPKDKTHVTLELKDHSDILHPKNYYYSHEDSSYFNHPEGQEKKWYTRYEVFMKIISNCPMGLEKWMHISTNYQQIKTIINQRDGHPLAEDYNELIYAFKNLPLAKEFLINEKRRQNDKNK